MAIKIVKREPSPKVLKFVVCYECGVELSYVPKDVKHYDSMDYSGCSDRYYYIPCPSCESKVNVK